MFRLFSILVIITLSTTTIIDATRMTKFEQLATELAELKALHASLLSSSSTSTSDPFPKTSHHHVLIQSDDTHEIIPKHARTEPEDGTLIQLQELTKEIAELKVLRDELVALESSSTYIKHARTEPENLIQTQTQYTPTNTQTTRTTLPPRFVEMEDEMDAAADLDSEADDTYTPSTNTGTRTTLPPRLIETQADSEYTPSTNTGTRTTLPPRFIETAAEADSEYTPSTNTGTRTTLPPRLIETEAAAQQEQGQAGGFAAKETHAQAALIEARQRLQAQIQTQAA